MSSNSSNPEPQGTNSDTESPDFPADWKSAVRPTTIRQVLGAELPFISADFRIGGHSIQTISVVANVIRVDQRSDDHIRKDHYVLDDGSSRGWIYAFHELPADAPLFDPPPDYVRVLGTLFVLGHKNAIRATRVLPVEDPHEVYLHLLDAMVVTLIHTKRRPDFASHEINQVHPMSSQSNVVAADQTSEILSVSQNSLPIRDSSPSRPPSAVPDTGDQTFGDESDNQSSISSSSTYLTAVVDDTIESPLPTSFSDLQLDHDMSAGTHLKRDPYSHLSTLQRDILLQVMNAAQQLHTPRLHVTTIRDCVRPGLWSKSEDISDALDYLVTQKYLCTDKDLLYYWIRNVSWDFEI
ncbi:unnamed protein product [Somion occarium]|uniref:Replication protein A C-terminal domain-containing protein n=1 Tax=Somion occarium TaxID=3059160 RepID=A0ABP1DCA4_9APHY